MKATHFDASYIFTNITSDIARTTVTYLQRRSESSDHLSLNSVSLPMPLVLGVQSKGISPYIHMHTSTNTWTKFSFRLVTHSHNTNPIGCNTWSSCLLLLLIRGHNFPDDTMSSFMLVIHLLRFNQLHE